MLEEQFELNQKVFCINESLYREHIKKRNEYKVQEVGVGSKEGMIRIKNNSGKLVWISNIHFTSTQIPKIVRITIDDEIADVENGFTDVTVEFENKERRYLIFMTVKYLSTQFNEFQKYRLGSQLIFVKELSQELIEEVILDLDLSNELILNSKEY